MKKIVLSAVFLALSGLYVAYANHLLGRLLTLSGKPSERQTAAAAEVGHAPSTPASKLPAVVPAIQPVIPSAIASSQPQPALADASLPPIVVDQSPLQPMPSPLAPADPIAAAELPAHQPTTKSEASSAGKYRDGSYTGTDENAYYGRVQVQVVVAQGRISRLKALDYPSDRRTSRSINGRALPILAQEVVRAQSDHVDTVTGATLTSEAYILSLRKALVAASAHA